MNTTTLVGRPRRTSLVDVPLAPGPNPLVSVNWHLTRACNLKCRFCFATFRDVRGQLSIDDGRRLLAALREAGTEKVNFAGGEPTLHPHIGALVYEARRLGFVVSIISNGHRLEALLDTHADALDWVGLSVDSADEAVQAALGRGRGDHISRSLRLARLIHRSGPRLKLNTVVTALNWREDLRPLVRLMRPERWKVFQVLPVEGQNDGDVDGLLITDSQFGAFVDRQASIDGVTFVPESNDAMTSSYLMLDPLGRFYGNQCGRYEHSQPVLDVGPTVAAAQVGFDVQRMVRRGGVYSW